MIKRLMKVCNFETRNRKRLTFSDKAKIRLNDDNKLDQALELKGSAGNYPTDADITVTTWTMTPRKLKKWLAFDAAEEIPDGTEIGYRLVVLAGTKELYWDGASWAVATLDSHWTTLADMSGQLENYSVEDFDLAIKIRLKSDGLATPRVGWVKLAMEVDLEAWDDLIYDTVIESMRSSLRAVTAIQAAIASNTSLIDLSTDPYRPLNTGYNFTGIRAAYDLTNDPKMFNNLASGYTPGAARPDGTFDPGQVALTSSLAAGAHIRLEMEYVPEIAVYTGQDYYEVPRVPAIAFEGITSVRRGDGHSQELNDGPSDYVRNLTAGTAIEVPRPRQSTVLFEFALHANPMDLALLADGVDQWVGSNRTLQTWAADFTVSVDPVEEVRTNKATNNDDVVSATGAFQLRGVPFFVRPAQDRALITNVNVTATDLNQG